MFDGWKIKLIEWAPPSKADNVQDAMRPIEFLNLSLKNDGDECSKLNMTLVNKVRTTSKVICSSTCICT